jgi:hypothetical protein
MEITTILTLTTIVGFALSVGTFFIGRQTASHNDGKKEGQILTELGYIKSGVDDMKRKMEQSDERYTLLASRVQSLEEKMNMYHHGGVS